MIPNSSHKPPASSKAPNQDLKDKDLLSTFKIKIERQNLDYGCIKDRRQYPNQEPDAKLQLGTSSLYQSLKWGLKGHVCSLHLQNQDREPKFGSYVYQNQWPYPYQDQDAKPHSGTSSILKSLKSGFKWYWSSLHLQNQNRELKFGHGWNKDQWPYPN